MVEPVNGEQIKRKKKDETETKQKEKNTRNIFKDIENNFLRKMLKSY